MSQSSAVRRKSFWFEGPWPRDAPDGSYVFLGRAVLEVGKALFLDSWSDDDPKMAFSHREAVNAERDRVKNVMERLGLATARGDIIFALRPDRGGEFKLQKEALDVRSGALVRFGKANWNVDDFTDHFKFAQMNDGIYRPEQAPPLDWIYIERQTLERFISGLSFDHDALKNTPMLPSGAVRNVAKQSDIELTAVPVTMLSQIRMIGVSNLSAAERQIWEAIKVIGGEDALPARRADYKELIKDNALGTKPSDSSIDRFMGRFGPAA